MLRCAVIGLVLLLFLVLSANAVRVHGYLGVFEAMNANAATRLAFIDLSLSLCLVLLWMRRDARDLALPFWRYVSVTVALGVAGPLAYLLHRELRGALAGHPLRSARSV
jgi:hypothetical protein